MSIQTASQSGKTRENGRYRKSAGRCVGEAAANKEVQCCMLRARLLLSMAAPCVAALRASAIADECLATRQPPLHPHAHALPSPSSPCACRRLHRGNQPRAMGALPAVGRCEPAQCARRPFMSRRKAWHQWALRSESRCGAPRVPPWACWRTATALQRPCVPRMQPHRTGPSTPSLGRVRSLIWLRRTHVCERAVL